MSLKRWTYPSLLQSYPSLLRDGRFLLGPEPRRMWRWLGLVRVVGGSRAATSLRWDGLFDTNSGEFWSVLLKLHGPQKSAKKEKRNDVFTFKKKCSKNHEDE